MARKAGQLISRGPRTWLARVSLGREPETGTRKYRNKTIRGSFREAQSVPFLPQYDSLHCKVEALPFPENDTTFGDRRSMK